MIVKLEMRIENPIEFLHFPSQIKVADLFKRSGLVNQSVNYYNVAAPDR